ncbi:MAG TPA: heavy metal translocating P-type ATPase [Agitococcus sp.]|nr:heavy metal translocating P-type ATPase [Agitococcus sp.]
MSESCFHCGEPLPATPYRLTILGKEQPLCCLGCYAVAETIVQNGLESYYLERTVISPTAAVPEALEQLTGYDHPDTQKQFIHREQDLACAELSVEGVSCAACAWLIEKRLTQEQSVKQVSLNLSNHRLRLLWDDKKTPLSHLLVDLEKLGYKARPFRTDTHASLLKKESRQLLMRLGVAGLGSMQAMMYAGSLYVAEDMTLDHRDFLRWVSLLITTPLFFYSAYPFYRSAWFSLKARTLNMDVPVTIALILTFAASIYNTVIGAPDVYYDSVTMFIFFLLAGRYVETQARRRASETANDLIPVIPRLSHRLLANGQTEDVPVTDLQIGEHILVKAGETIPCDGQIIQGQSSVSEALLTGEALPISKQQGDTVVSGSQNHQHPLTIEVSQIAQASTLATIHQLINRALAEKPELAEQADKFAHWFILSILLLSLVVYGAWSVVNPNFALLATIAVLVATCPCALSLATPVALTAATHRLAQQGFLVTRGHVINRLAQATHIIFDKTGTLTTGQLQLVNQQTLQGDAQQALLIAAALEQYSEHPIAYAFKQLQLSQLPTVEQLKNELGLGLSAVIDGKSYKLGHSEFALGENHNTENDDFLRIYLSCNQQAIAYFDFKDTTRHESATLIQQLKKLGLKTVLLSGDRSQAPYLLAKELAIDEAHGGLLPQDKAEYVHQQQALGAVVIMVGDGVNDAPVLGQSHVSIAMSSGADLAQMTADAVLLGDRLPALMTAQQVSRKTSGIIKQNLAWAFMYNLVILPPAALGYVPPWLAAIGMSLSSLFVVFNALRV